MRLPEYIREIISEYNKNGFEAYAVGGCVRDELLGKRPFDYDIATSALPDETKSVFSNRRLIETGIKHGTLTLMADEGAVEITTFRVDGEYSDSRHPESVCFTRNLSDDLSRRDFTVNAMAYSEKAGIVDIFGGKEDLENRLIRCVGEAPKRFDEDALRIMRALRFSASCGFEIEEKTALAIRSKKELLKNISGERIATELNKLLLSDCTGVLREFYDVFSVIIPEISSCVGFEQHSQFHDKTVWEHIVSSVGAIEAELPLRLCMLFHDLGKPSCYTNENGTGHFKGHAAVSTEIARRVMRELHYDNKTLNHVVFLVEHHDMRLCDDRRLIKKWLSRFGEEAFFDLVKVHIADDSAKTPECKNRIGFYKKIEDIAREIIEEGDCLSIKSLDIDGNTLVSLGFEGKEIGDALRMLLEAVIAEKCPNEREYLVKYLENNGKK